MIKNKKHFHAILLISIIVIQLVFLIFIKYSNQSLSLKEISFANLGNLFNVIASIILITGIVVYSKKPDSKLKTIYLFAYVTFIALCIAYFSTKINFPGKGIYIGGQPGDKVFDALLFTFYEFLLFAFISYIWLKVFGANRMAFARSLANSAFLLLIFLIFTFLFIQTKGFNSDCWNIEKNKNNTIVVLGAAVWTGNKPSPSLSGRVDEAIKLYHEGYGGKIILTGSNAPGEMSESEVAYEYAKSKGMDMDKVEFETTTTSTIEQVSFIRRNLIPHEKSGKIIVVSDVYHLMRVLEVSKFFNTDIKVAASETNLNFQENVYRQLRESIALNVFWSFAL